jgi:hypothetical protein
MDELASTATARKVPQRPDRSHAALRDEIRRLWESRHGRTIRYDQLDGLEAVAAYYLRLAAREGPVILRSVPQAARGIGWNCTGRVKVDSPRHHKSLLRRLETLREIGWGVEDFSAEYAPNGAPKGIRVVLSYSG